MLTHQQGEAARKLLAYVASLPLDGPDAQLLAMVVVIRAARSGVGNLTGTDLRSLRLTDADRAVAALTALGWKPASDLLLADPQTPVAIVVPAFSGEAGPTPLPFGKVMRSRVSGWSMRTMAAKPLRKTDAATRLAALFLAANGSADDFTGLPAELPGPCVAALPELLRKGFLAELESDRYRLHEAVSHLCGKRPEACAAADGDPGTESRAARAKKPVTPEMWEAWKDQRSPALRRHAEAVEHCSLCAPALARVAEAFVREPLAVPVQRKVLLAYEEWEATQPDRGPRAAEFAAAFRAEHGHGPSAKQLCLGLGWKKRGRGMWHLIVQRLVADGWLTNTAPVPWTLRPGKAASVPGPAGSPRPHDR
ncbi:hypothetical protein F0344_31830 [Streptomyces finlayi]|uniref:Uncharacterized protein n=1 Tax=Streptomyces finlayi TaxID=67296 RepID=A0A7G7BW04_9ACTN|nr:hypothetical protein F0344_31830 [Streptomyces finlayi]